MRNPPSLFSVYYVGLHYNLFTLNLGVEPLQTIALIRDTFVNLTFFFLRYGKINESSH